MTELRRLVAVPLVALLLGSARADPPIRFAGRTIDLASDQVLATDAGAPGCPDASAFPAAIARAEARRPRSGAAAHLPPVEATTHHVLFATDIYDHAHESAVIELSERRALPPLSATAVALVEDEAGSLLGVLALDKHDHGLVRWQLEGTRWRRVWKIVLPAAQSTSAVRAVVADDRVYVAPFDHLSTDQQLYALDWATGALAWTGDVRSVRAAHSKYHHDVRLRHAGARIILEDVESAGCSLQSFDTETGARRLEVTELPGGWGK